MLAVYVLKIHFEFWVRFELLIHRPKEKSLKTHIYTILLKSLSNPIRLAWSSDFILVPAGAIASPPLVPFPLPPALPSPLASLMPVAPISVPPGSPVLPAMGVPEGPVGPVPPSLGSVPLADLLSSQVVPYLHGSVCFCLLGAGGVDIVHIVDKVGQIGPVWGRLPQASPRSP